MASASEVVHPRRPSPRRQSAIAQPPLLAKRRHRKTTLLKLTQQGRAPVLCWYASHPITVAPCEEPARQIRRATVKRLRPNRRARAQMRGGGMWRWNISSAAFAQVAARFGFVRSGPPWKVLGFRGSLGRPRHQIQQKIKAVPDIGHAEQGLARPGIPDHISGDEIGEVGGIG